MIENIDRSALVAQRTEAERLTSLLLRGFSDEERKSDVWINILGGYFVGRKDVANLLINKGRPEAVRYIHDAVVEVRANRKLFNGITELWTIINEKFKIPQLLPVFDYLLSKWKIEKEVAEAKFIGGWDLASEFRILDITYSFLSPENNGVKSVHITEMHTRATTALSKYRR